MIWFILIIIIYPILGHATSMIWYMYYCKKENGWYSLGDVLINSSGGLSWDNTGKYITLKVLGYLFQPIMFIWVVMFMGIVYLCRKISEKIPNKFIMQMDKFFNKDISGGKK